VPPGDVLLHLRQDSNVGCLQRGREGVVESTTERVPGWPDFGGK
jgi:hypothetical protein